MFCLNIHKNNYTKKWFTQLLIHIFDFIRTVYICDRLFSINDWKYLEQQESKLWTFILNYYTSCNAHPNMCWIYIFLCDLHSIRFCTLPKPITVYSHPPNFLFVKPSTVDGFTLLSHAPFSTLFMIFFNFQIIHFFERHSLLRVWLHT